MAGKNKPWREFEEAVAIFAAAMDPCAKVSHDVRLPDRHSRRPRQRDVWIEAKICRHFPVAVLVSCKHWKKKVAENDIDAFNGELQSSDAHKGVIYSYSGFTRPALEKANVLGICCCSLYRGEPPKVPDCLIFHAYHCRSRVSLAVSPFPFSGWAIKTWGDLFDVPLSTDESQTAVLDELVRRFMQAEREAAKPLNQSGRRVPRPFEAEVLVSPLSDKQVPLRVVAHGTWRFFRAKLEAYLLKGSYSFSTGQYIGEIATPSIDRLSADPGPGWELLDSEPEDLSRSLVMLLYHGAMKEVLLEGLAAKKIAAEKPA